MDTDSTGLVQIRCIQINLQHSKSATNNLLKITDTEETDIIFAQEPYVYQNGPVGFGKKYRVFSAGTGKHRTAIIIRNDNIDAILVSKISDEDTVVLELIFNNLKFYAISMYFDIQGQIESNLNKIDEIMKLTKGGKVPIAAYTNARSKTWHDHSTNSRGKKLEEFLVATQLHIINEYSERNTFNNTRGVSNIDLTITNNNLLKHVLDWEISEEESLADHNYIKFKLSMGKGYNNINTDKYSNTKFYIREDKLHLFDNKLVQEMQRFDTGTRNIADAVALDIYISNVLAKGIDIERNIDIIEESIISTCRRTFGRHKTTNNNRKKNSVPWWNTHLTAMGRKVNANRRLFQRTKNDEALRERRKATYKEAKRNYQAEINKAKLNSWKEFCNVAASVNP